MKEKGRGQIFDKGILRSLPVPPGWKGKWIKAGVAGGEITYDMVMKDLRLINSSMNLFYHCRRSYDL